MIEISNFSSVLEIGFAINALFFIFDFAPSIENKIDRLLKKHASLRAEKIQITKNSESFPIKFVLGTIYPPLRMIISVISVILSLVCLWLLIWSGFFRDAQISNGIMIIILIFTLCTVPISAILLNWYARRLVLESMNKLEADIMNHLENKK